MTSPNGERRPDPHPSGVKEVHHDSTTSLPQPLDPKRVPPGVAPLLKTWIGELLASVAQQRDNGELRPCKHRAKLAGWPCHWMSWWPEYLFCSTCARDALCAARVAKDWRCVRCDSQDGAGSALVIPISGGTGGILNVGIIACNSCRPGVGS